MDKRKRRVKKIKIAIIVVLTVFLLLPSALCCVLFYQMSRLSGEVRELRLWKETTVKAVGTEDPDAAGTPGPDGAEEGSGLQGDVGSTPLGFIGTKGPEGSAGGEDTDSAPGAGGEDTDSGPGADGEATGNSPGVGSDAKAEGDSAPGNHKKAVYLTFDDGPSENTPQILDILAEYEVYATFFVVGKADEHSLEMYRRIVEEGHTLGMHSYSHDYSKLYKSLASFQEDYEKLAKLLYGATAELPKFYRFPGGSSNEVSKEDMAVFISWLEEQGTVYFDWNVASGDAVKDPPDADTLVENVLAGVEKYDEPVVLMHDLAGKETTLEALPALLEMLEEQGIEVLPIGEGTTPVHHKLKK